MKLKRSIPLAIFLLFCAWIVGWYLHCQPSWGLMDDAAYRGDINKIWDSPTVLKGFVDYFQDENVSKLRPLYSVLAFFVYRLFKDAPLFLYILIFLSTIAFLPVWGYIFSRVFSRDQKFDPAVVFLFPLSFFIFTPFWNIFMYIPLQERLIFVFSTISVAFFVKAIEDAHYGSLALAIIAAFLCLLSKPTGVFLLVTLGVFLVLEVTVFKSKQAKVYWRTLATIGFTVLVYFIFVKLIVKPGGYSYRYIQNFSVFGILGSIHQSLVTKALFYFCLFCFPLFIALINKGYFRRSSLLIPLGFLCQILVLAPWGMTNYFLAPLAPFVMGLFFPGYYYLRSLAARAKFFWSIDGILLVSIVFVTTQVILPRISKMGDITGAIQKIESIDRHGEASFYMPAPCLEASDSLKTFTHADITYLPGRVLERSLLTNKPAYLITREECPIVSLRGVAIRAHVYENNTWQFYSLFPLENSTTELDLYYGKTFLQKIISKNF